MKQLIRVSITLAIINLFGMQSIFAQSEAMDVDADGNIAVKGNITARNLPVATTTGDMYYWDNGWKRVAVGTENQLLIMRGNVPTWMSLPIRKVGDKVDGGIVCYILRPTDRGYEAGKIHGLIAHPNDIGDATWGCYGSSPDVSIDMGAGKKNTDAIAAMCGGGSAAAQCKALRTNGYADWYLPSRDELNKMYYSIDQVGGFAAGEYLSSSQSDKFKAYVFRFLGNAGTLEIFKDWKAHVRPVRSF